MEDFSPFEKDIIKQAMAAEEKAVKVDKADQQKSWDKISKRMGFSGSDTEPKQGRLDIDDAERKNREANAKKSIQDLRDLREGKITNDDLKERVRARGGSGGGGGGAPSDKMDKMKKMNYKAGGSVKSASKRADGCCIRGKTRA
jgi:hypothetical protein